MCDKVFFLDTSHCLKIYPSRKSQDQGKVKETKPCFFFSLLKGN